MTEVYINQQRAYFKEDTSLKLTIENTFFEDAGSYTLDVTFPLDIEQNRRIFGPMGRLDVSKRQQSFDALIVVDNRPVFKGTAKITGVNDREVKLQMLSGNSSVKFWTKAQKMYIDELHYEYTDTNHSFDGYKTDDAFWGTPLIVAGTFPGKKGVYCYVPTLDESGSAPVENCYKGLWNEHHLMINVEEHTVIYHGGEPMYKGYYIEVNRECICPNLMFVAKWIFQHLGYRLDRNDRDSDFVNGIYIANARNTTTFRRHDMHSNSADEMSMAKALPHWTVEEFIKQLQNFLNATVVFDDIKGTVDIIASAYTTGMVDITADVLDEYEVEVIDDEDVAVNLYDSNVKYKEGTSEYHGIDLVEQEVISSFSEVKCTYQEFLAQWDAMSAVDRKHTIWTTERGQFCAKVDTGDNNTETLTPIRFNHFGAIVRNTDNENDVELKISPVATTKEVEMPVFEWDGAGANVYRDAFQYRWTTKQTVLCLHNQYEASNKPTVWDALQGNNDSGTEKEDVMQVFLMDDMEVATGFYHLTYQVPFTHPEWQKPNDRVQHKSWSLALAADDAVSTIGGLHSSARLQNRNAEHRIRFKAYSIPSVYAVFLVRNKRYACKKLEVQFSSTGMERVIFGYFEEIL
jgi:hypothetical protein